MLSFWKDSILLNYTAAQTLLHNLCCVIIVELCQTILAVTVETRANAFPIAGTHGVGDTDRRKRLAVGAVPELVFVLDAVVGDAQPESLEPARLHDLLLAVELSIDALRTKPDGVELLADAEEAGIARAFC